MVFQSIHFSTNWNNWPPPTTSPKITQKRQNILISQTNKFNLFIYIDISYSRVFSIQFEYLIFRQNSSFMSLFIYFRAFVDIVTCDARCSQKVISIFITLQCITNADHHEQLYKSDGIGSSNT